MFKKDEATLNLKLNFIRLNIVHSELMLSNALYK